MFISRARVREEDDDRSLVLISSLSRRRIRGDTGAFGLTARLSSPHQGIGPHRVVVAAAAASARRDVACLNINYVCLTVYPDAHALACIQTASTKSHRVEARAKAAHRDPLLVLPSSVPHTVPSSLLPRLVTKRRSCTVHLRRRTTGGDVPNRMCTADDPLPLIFPPLCFYFNRERREDTSGSARSPIINVSSREATRGPFEGEINDGLESELANPAEPAAVDRVPCTQVVFAIERMRGIGVNRAEWTELVWKIRRQ